MKNKHKTLREFFTALLLILGALVVLSPILAAPDIGQATQYIPLQGTGYNVFPKPEGADGVEVAKGLVGKIADNLRFIIGAVATLFLIISAIKLIISEGNEEVYNKEETAIIMAVVGLFIVGLAGEISQILSVEKGTFLKDPNTAIKQSRIFNKNVQIVLTFIKFIIGSVSVLFIVRSGLKMVLEGDDEEVVGKEKKTIAWGLVGLLFILLATPLVNNVFFKIDTSMYPGTDAVRPRLDPKSGLGEIVGVTNFIVSFVAPFAILSLIAGGIMYIVAGGEDEKIETAKKVIMWSIIGIVVIYGAFGIVSTVISGRFEGI